MTSDPVPQQLMEYFITTHVKMYAHSSDDNVIQYGVGNPDMEQDVRIP
jgi:hypothetical protein